MKSQILPCFNILLVVHLVALVSVRATQSSFGVWFYMHLYLTLMHIAPASIITRSTVR